jgi:hypothetical protein
VVLVVWWFGVLQFCSLALYRLKSCPSRLDLWLLGLWHEDLIVGAYRHSEGRPPQCPRCRHGEVSCLDCNGALNLESREQITQRKQIVQVDCKYMQIGSREKSKRKLRRWKQIARRACFMRQQHKTWLRVLSLCSYAATVGNGSKAG